MRGIIRRGYVGFTTFLIITLSSFAVHAVDTATTATATADDVGKGGQEVWQAWGEGPLAGLAALFATLLVVLRWQPVVNFLHEKTFTWLRPALGMAFAGAAGVFGALAAHGPWYAVIVAGVVAAFGGKWAVEFNKQVNA